MLVPDLEDITVFQPTINHCMCEELIESRPGMSRSVRQVLGKLVRGRGPFRIQSRAFDQGQTPDLGMH